MKPKQHDPGRRKDLISTLILFASILILFASHYTVRYIVFKQHGHGVIDRETISLIERPGIRKGIVRNINTSGFNIGDTLYLGLNGGLVTSRQCFDSADYYYELAMQQDDLNLFCKYALIHTRWVDIYCKIAMGVIRESRSKITRSPRKTYTTTKLNYFYPGDTLTSKENGALTLWDSTMSRDLIVGFVTDSGTFEVYSE